jgi:hypothetical protein
MEEHWRWAEQARLRRQSRQCQTPQEPIALPRPRAASWLSRLLHLIGTQVAAAFMGEPAYEAAPGDESIGH